MKKSDIDNTEYINKLEDTIVELSLQLKGKKNELNSIQIENQEHIKKIVHNLKNPIGVAFSFSEMFTESKNDISSEKREKYLNIIKDSSEFSIQLLNSIGDLNRLKSPNFKLNKTKTNYNTLVNNTIKHFEENLADKNSSIESEFSNNTLFLNIDALEIVKVLKILLNNALRYSQNKSAIHIKIKENVKSTETIVSDTGIGISENNLKVIFDEFSAINTYSEDGQKCVGMGLSIAKRIIQFHNGQISAHSNFGSGSIFKFTIPNK